MENRANKIYKSSNETYKELKQQVAMLKEQLKDLQEKQTRKETNTLGSACDAIKTTEHKNCDNANNEETLT